MGIGEQFEFEKTGNILPETARKVNSELSAGLYGVVEWINGNPTLDGMPCFDDKDAALEYATERKNMGNMGLPCHVKYTIIRLTKAI